MVFTPPHGKRAHMGGIRGVLAQARPGYPQEFSLAYLVFIQITVLDLEVRGGGFTVEEEREMFGWDNLAESNRRVQGIVNDHVFI